MDNTNDKPLSRAGFTVGRGSIGTESNVDIYAPRKPQETLKLSIFGFEKLQNPTYGFFKRSLWLLATCLCFIICLWQLYDRISLYLSHPTALQMTLNRTCDIQFPTFTLCPAKSPFDINTTKKLYNNKFCKDDLHSCSNVANTSFEKLGLTLEEVWEEFSVTDDDVAVWTVCSSAEVKANKCHRPPNITISQTRMHPIDTVLGRCLTVAMDAGSKFHGASTFLEIQMKHGQYHDLIYQQMVAAKFYYQASEKVNKVCGFGVREELPMKEMIVIRLQRKQFQNLNLPWKSCDENFNINSCVERCADLAIAELLNCRLPFVNASNLSPCETFQQAATEYHKAVGFYKTFNPYECPCQPLCKETVYTGHITKKRNIDEGNHTTIWIQFADDVLEVAAEVETYKGGDLLSDIGGSLGFFLGICVLHILEFFDELFQKGLEVVGAFLPKERSKGQPFVFSNLRSGNTTARCRSLKFENPNMMQICTLPPVAR